MESGLKRVAIKSRGEDTHFKNDVDFFIPPVFLNLVLFNLVFK